MKQKYFLAYEFLFLFFLFFQKEGMHMHCNNK